MNCELDRKMNCGQKENRNREAEKLERRARGRERDTKSKKQLNAIQERKRMKTASMRNKETKRNENK